MPKRRKKARRRADPLKTLRKFVHFTARTFSVLAVVLLVTVSGWMIWRVSSQLQNPGFAAHVFDGVVPVETIIASRKWHRIGAEPWDCTFAIATLAEGAPVEPPEDTRADPGWRFRFGGIWPWRPTPAPPLGDTTRDALAVCRSYWSDEIGRTLDHAMSTSGAWYARDPVGETVFLYAPDIRLAARIRYGD